MGGTTAIASGGNPQDRAASPRPRCLPCSLAASLNFFFSIEFCL
ncbi:hypothetical protein [Moorena sp. SIOASIH]|nr:hypothetical protein [Moorena sp. SIOASIH]